MIVKNVVLVKIQRFNIRLTLHCVPPIHKIIHILKDMIAKVCGYPYVDKVHVTMVIDFRLTFQNLSVFRW